MNEYQYKLNLVQTFAMKLVELLCDLDDPVKTAISQDEYKELKRTIKTLEAYCGVHDDLFGDSSWLNLVWKVFGECQFEYEQELSIMQERLDIK